MDAGDGTLASDIQDYIQNSLLHGRSIALDENLLLSGLLDSLAVMNLIAELERRIGAPIPPADVTIENFQSVDAMIAYLSRQAAA